MTDTTTKAERSDDAQRRSAAPCSTANPTHHTCHTCGYVLEHGKHGGHSCSERLKARVAKMEAALLRIERWFGEFPETGKFWDDDPSRPMSYSSCHGSNGERDYMRGIARDALQ